MQILPHCNISYKEFFRIPIGKDDRGKNYSLVKFIGKGETRFWSDIFKKEVVTKRKIEDIRVMCDETETYSNKATGREERLFWKSKRPKLRKLKIKYYQLEEILSGQHCMFWPHPNSKEYGMATRFKITNLK